MQRTLVLFSAINETADKGVAFAFITYVHVGSNRMRSPMLLKYLQSHGYINKVVCGRDIIYNCYDNKNKALDELLKWANETRTLNIVTLLGNHDLNSDNQTKHEAELEESDFYEIVSKPSASRVVYPEGELYGYEDDVKQRVRYIYLNTGAPDSSVIDTEQLGWMQERLLELNSNWTTIVFCHQFWTGRWG